MIAAVSSSRGYGKTVMLDEMFDEALERHIEYANDIGCGVRIELHRGAKLVYVDSDLPVGEVLWMMV